MKNKQILSVAGVFVLFLFVGSHGPFSKHHKGDDHPHTHKKHVIKLLRADDDDSPLSIREYIPVTS